MALFFFFNIYYLNLCQKNIIMKGMESTEWIEKYTHHWFFSFCIRWENTGIQRAWENNIFQWQREASKRKRQMSVKRYKILHVKSLWEDEEQPQERWITVITFITEKALRTLAWIHLSVVGSSRAIATFVLLTL